MSNWGLYSAYRPRQACCSAPTYRRASGRHSEGAGSNLYASAAFVVILAVVGGFILRDAWKTYRSGNMSAEEMRAGWLNGCSSIRHPRQLHGLFQKPQCARIGALHDTLGFATGMLAATTRRGRIHRRAVHDLCARSSGARWLRQRKLVIAFVMGVGGTLKYGLGGLVDIRLADDHSCRLPFRDSARGHRHDLCGNLS
ncbi:MAG: hypothetical protein MZV70_44185 [Desulfobacterales bacterium]|nr:hypothetical protein [Desulfobacterales bacterium]